MLRRYILLFALVCASILSVYSQESAENVSSYDLLEDSEPIEAIDVFSSHDNIEYEIPDDILFNLRAKPGSLKKNSKPVVKNKKPGGIVKKQGYRIQVFSDGRNPSTLQSRAKERGRVIVSKFPKYRGQVYTFSTSPNWYTRIGNFATSQEASKALTELKRAFPQFAGEMRVVKSQVSIR